MDSDHSDTESTATTNNDLSGKYASSSSSDTIWGHENETIWNKIQRVTYADNKNYWRELMEEDKSQFQLKFKASFLESCKSWILQLCNFVDDDQTWAALMDTKAQIYESVEDDEEALLSAVDTRKYKLYKTIDWGKIESDLLEDDDSSSEEEDNNGDQLSIVEDEKEKGRKTKEKGHKTNQFFKNG